MCVLAEVTYLNQEQLKTRFLFTALTKEPHIRKKYQTRNQEMFLSATFLVIWEGL